MKTYYVIYLHCPNPPNNRIYYSYRDRRVDAEKLIISLREKGLNAFLEVK